MLAEELRSDEVSGEDKENAGTEISVELENVRVRRSFLVPERCASKTKEMQTARRPKSEGIRMVGMATDHGRVAGAMRLLQSSRWGKRFT